MSDTCIIIDIRTPDNTEVLECIRETFGFMPGWLFSFNVGAAPSAARFFTFNLTTKVFNWWRTNQTFSDTMDEDEVVIRDLADISNLLEFIYVNTEKLRGAEDLNSAFAAWFETPSTTPAETPKTEFNMNQMISPMEFIHIKTPKDLTQSLYNMYYNMVCNAKGEGSLVDLYNKVAGLHGPLASKLRQYIDKEIQAMKHKEKTHLNSMDALMTAEMDKYYEYLIEKKQEEVAKEYNKDGLWGYGWKHSPMMHDSEGMIIKFPPYGFKSSPYSWSDVHPDKEMDY